MKILLIDPPGQGNRSGSFPLGLMYIQAYLKCNGYPATFLRRLNSTGRSLVQELIDGLEPDVVGITCLTGNHRQTLYIAEIIKAYRPSIRLVLGGHHATFMRKQILDAYPFVDHIVCGEGEVSFKELLDSFGSGYSGRLVAGSSGRNEKGMAVDGPQRAPVADLDSLPFPCYDDVQEICCSAEAFPILASRGCPFACSYCAGTAYYGHARRQRSVDNIIAEMRHLKRMRGPGEVIFYDDFLTADIQHARDLFSRITKENFDFKLVVQTRLDHLDADLLARMDKAGVVKIWFGFESGSKEVLESVNRSWEYKKALVMVKEAARLGIMTQAKLVIGWPSEDWRALRATAQRLVELNPYSFQVICYVVMPGTAIYERLKNSGEISDDHWLKEGRHIVYLSLKRGWLARPLFHSAFLFLLVSFLWRTKSCHRVFNVVYHRLEYEISCAKVLLANIFCK